MSRRALRSTERRRRFVRMILAGRPYVECHYCGAHIAQGTLTLDHVVPLSKGGAMGIRNIVPACRACNCKRGNRDYREYVARCAV